MINLGKLNPTQGTYASQFNYISVDELTEFCSVQLQACDKQIRSLTSNQQDIVNNAESIANAQKELNDLAASVGKQSDQKLSSGDSNAFHLDSLNKTLSALQGLADNASEPAKSAIQNEIDKLKSHCEMNPDGTVAKMKSDLLQSDVTDMVKTDLQPVADKLQSDQSMNMIKVQSAVSQREQMVQLVTGLIQKMNEMVSSVVNNIGK